MKTNIKIIDCDAIKTFHEVFSLSLIIMCARFADKVTYNVGKSAYLNITKLKNKQKNIPSNINIKKKAVFEKDSKLGAFIRTLTGFFITLYEYTILSRQQILIFAATNPLSFPIIITLNILLRKKIIFTIHGELELQRNSPRFGHPSWLYKRMHTIGILLLRYSPKSKLLVLGESIKRNLCKIFPHAANNIISINHPILNVSWRKPVSNKSTTPLTIGTTGVMKKEKGIQNLIKLSNLLNKEVKKGLLTIKSIGKVEGVDVTPYTLIEWIGKESVMPREDFDKYINELDYILYLYPTDSYKLTASGAIMDSIRLQIPILSLENDFFCELMKDVSIGYICKTTEELADVIRDLLYNNKKKDYSLAFKELANKASISYNSTILESALKQSKFI